MNDLHDKILAALPCGMRELEKATGAHGQTLWDAVTTLRRTGQILRKGPHGDRVYERNLREEKATPEHPSPGMAALEEKRKERKSRKRPVILFWIEGWPSQDPGRRMVWSIGWGSRAKAERELKDLKERLGDKGEWELVNLSMAEVNRLKAKRFSLAEQREREKMLRAMEDAAPPGS